MIAAYPLQWPDFIPRSPRREDSRFKATLAGALNNVETSIRRFAADSGKPVKDIVLSSNCALGVSRPDDPGVAAWFVWDGEQLCIPVDRYRKPEENLQAIHHIIEARRVELRHGTLALVKATFRGFRALPNPANKRTWRDVFGYQSGAVPSMDDLRARYRSLAQARHPDRGGSESAMSEINVAKEQAEKELRA